MAGQRHGNVFSSTIRSAIGLRYMRPADSGREARTSTRFHPSAPGCGADATLIVAPTLFIMGEESCPNSSPQPIVNNSAALKIFHVNSSSFLNVRGQTLRPDYEYATLNGITSLPRRSNRAQRLAFDEYSRSRAALFCASFYYKDFAGQASVQ
jgi:hypothetical protein